MDKKPSNLNFAIRLMVILAFFAIALFPMCLMAIDGPERPNEEAQEDTVELVALTSDNYLSGKFQTTFESWLSKYYPLRSSIVTTYRQIKMDIENAGVMVEIMSMLKGDVTDPGQQGTTCVTHVDDDFNGICDVCAKKLYDVPVGGGQGGDDSQGGSQGGDDSQGGGQGGDDSQGGSQGGDDNQGGGQGGDDSQGGGQGGDDNQGGNQGGDDNQGGNQGGDDSQGGNQGGDDSQGGNQGGDDSQGGNQGGDDNQGGSQGGDDNQGGNQGGAPEPPVNVYLDPLDPKNIYAEINRLQLLQGDPVEPKGFKGNSRVWIGKSGYLYEQTYIDEYMGYTYPYVYVSDSGLQQTVDKLEYIQQELEKRGITMLYIITPSKASAYSDYIPDHYKNSHTAQPGYVRPIERLRTMLAASSVNYLDSVEYYKQIGLLVTFPKTGIHWNALASTEATAKLLSMYQQLSGKTSATIKITGVNAYDEPPSSVNNEQDIFKILYNMVDASYRDSAIKDDHYYAPEVEIVNQNADKLNVLVQGGSFAHSIVHYLSDYGIANVSQIYYTGQNTKTGSISASDPWQKGPEAWEYWLKDKDLVIFEANEQQIRSGHKTSSQTWYEAAGYGRVDGDMSIGHNVVYDSLYEYLKAHEGEY